MGYIRLIFFSLEIRCLRVTVLQISANDVVWPCILQLPLDTIGIMDIFVTMYTAFICLINIYIYIIRYDMTDMIMIVNNKRIYIYIMH